MENRPRIRKPAQLPLTRPQPQLPQLPQPQLPPPRTKTPPPRTLPTQHRALRRTKVSCINEGRLRLKTGLFSYFQTSCLHVSPEGDAAAEDNEETEETDEQDEEKMKTSDEVEWAAMMTVLLLYIIHVQLRPFKHQSTSCQFPTGHSWTRSNSIRGHVIHSQLHSAQQIHLF